jgi:hypothetical protein
LAPASAVASGRSDAPIVPLSSDTPAQVTAPTVTIAVRPISSPTSNIVGITQRIAAITANRAPCLATRQAGMRRRSRRC